MIQEGQEVGKAGGSYDMLTYRLKTINVTIKLPEIRGVRFSPKLSRICLGFY